MKHRDLQLSCKCIDGTQYRDSPVATVYTLDLNDINSTR